MTGPYALLLGTAQDAGLPQLGCEDELCRGARADPRRARLVVSLLLVDPRSGSRWLFEATPDIAVQVELARGHGTPAVRTEGSAGRPPLFDGVFLTHAHIGHYTGLMELGREAYGTANMPVYGTRRMTEFLATNGPWSLMAEEQRIELLALEPNRPLELAPGLTVTPVPVPHRDEFSDTFAYEIRGPARSLFFVPDIDKWSVWQRDLADVVRSVDFALLDGSFFEDGEIPGRSMADIPHPFMVETIAQLAPLPASERSKVHFIHLNHTNPANDPSSPAAQSVRAAGMSVAEEFQRFELGAHE